jgi:UDP-glucose 4-epimerase
MPQEMNYFSGKKICITGGGGFLATNLIRRLSSTDCRIIRVLRSGSLPQHIETKGAIVEDLIGDIRERSTWADLKCQPDFIFHFAAQTSVYTAEKDAAADWRSNALPLLHLFEICKERAWHPGVIFSGTATQFGLATSLPVNETQQDRPVTVYDLHKSLAQAYLEHHVRLGSVKGATLRLPNIYGPGPTSNNVDRSIINKMMQRALSGEQITLYGDGSQLRDYLFVDDAVEGFLAAASHLEQINGSYFVLGSGQGHSLREAFNLVAERAALITGHRVPVISVAPPSTLSPIEERNFVADISTFHAVTGWSPRVSLTQGIDLTLASLRTPQPISL